MNSKSKKRLTDHNNFSKRKCVKGDHPVSINDRYLKTDFITKFSEGISKGKDVDFEGGAHFFAQPFPCGVLPNFLNSDEFIKSLKQDLDEVTMLPKSSDLFQFKQSKDLSTSPLPAVRKLTRLLYGDCLPLMEKITNMSLTSEIDLTCSIYENTDVLLCHDDMLKGRAIAFIYYLVPDWEANDGGALDIFHSEKANATEIARSLVPLSNNFVFFEVSPASFHQVAEVLKDKRRLSVNGWFHSSFNKAKIIPNWQDNILFKPETLQNVDITHWINPIYLEAENILQIRSTFEEMSEIELHDFLKEEKYAEVAAAINSDSVTWKMVGPRNRRRFEEATFIPPIVKECTRIMHSEEMCLILSNLTGLALHPLAEIESGSSDDDSDSESDTMTACNSHSKPSKKETSHVKNMECEMAKYSTTTRRWSHGCYTLLHDKLMEGKSELDAVLYFNCTDWNPESGGFTSYVANGEEEELLRIEPKSNSLALVYTDELTAGFVKYINNSVIDNGNSGIFHDIFTTYYEQTAE